MQIKKLLFLLLILPAIVSAQDDKKKIAAELKDEAVKIMDNGDSEAAIRLLDSAKKLDPDDYVYEYETGFAYYLKKDYLKAVECFKRCLNYKNAPDLCYQMMGNAYDMAGDREKSIEAYKEGLKKFPNAGRLCLELGNLEYNAEKYDEAVTWWEKGITVQPDYPSNYYSLAKLWTRTKDRLWGLLYGELFMNIERSSKRTSEVSELLVNTWRKAVTFTDTSTRIDLVNDVLTVTDLKKKPALPFKFIMGMDLMVALTPSLVGKEKKISIASLHTTRAAFIERWHKEKRDKNYPNVLLDYNKTLIEKGYFESYNYWLFSQGDQDEFSAWYDKNKDKFKEFITWFKENPLPVSKSQYFLRTQYD
jgi:tetratricopeptide (TPR) repeat protein